MTKVGFQRWQKSECHTEPVGDHVGGNPLWGCEFGGKAAGRAQLEAADEHFAKHWQHEYADWIGTEKTWPDTQAIECEQHRLDSFGRQVHLCGYEHAAYGCGTQAEGNCGVAAQIRLWSKRSSHVPLQGQLHGHRQHPAHLHHAQVSISLHSIVNVLIWQKSPSSFSHSRAVLDLQPVACRLDRRSDSAGSGREGTVQRWADCIAHCIWGWC